MIIDAHYHLEEQVETVDALLGQIQRHSIKRVALIPKMNEPFHLKGLAKKAGGLLPRMLMSRLRFLGLLLYNSTVTSDGRISALGTKYLLYHKPDNEYVDNVIQTYPDNFYGWIFVNPKVSDPINEVERWFGKQGWIGVKAHPFWHSYPVNLLDDVAAFCVERGLPILVHLGGSHDHGDYRFLPERHQRLRIIYAHAAVPFYREIWSYAKEKENISVDLSNPVYVDEEILPSVIKVLGAKKCLYGTDGPYVNATQGRMLERILKLPLSGYEKEQILGRNFLELIEV
jgi:predicted TIM-barrel fold metal-dependent hydrolase